jgi:hypothetical protein
MKDSTKEKIVKIQAATGGFGTSGPPNPQGMQYLFIEPELLREIEEKEKEEKN